MGVVVGTAGWQKARECVQVVRRKAMECMGGDGGPVECVLNGSWVRMCLWGCTGEWLGCGVSLAAVAAVVVGVNSAASRIVATARP